jgi:YD repeat-containing protein
MRNTRRSGRRGPDENALSTLHPRRLLTAALCLLLAGVTPAPAQAPAIQYGDDALGRLVVVTDQSGDTAVYNYDAVGNLLSIERVNAPALPAPVVITAVTPGRGKAGTTVSIFGKGFGATPGDNVVAFNGGLAAVTAAAPNRLIVTVPPSAITGPITVTAPGGSAVSPKPFGVPGPLVLSPATATVGGGGSQAFTPQDPAGATPPVLWAVNDVPGGNGAVGSISEAGLYRAPTVATAMTVAVTATDADDPSFTASAAVTVMPSGAPLLVTAPGVSVSPLALRQPATLTVASGVTAAIAAAASPTAVTSASVALTQDWHPNAVATASPVSVTLEPVITEVSPAGWPRGVTELAVTLGGSGLTEATAVSFLRNDAIDPGITISGLSVNAEGTEATVVISIDTAAVPGLRVVRITTPAGTSTAVATGSNAFTAQ